MLIVIVIIGLVYDNMSSELAEIDLKDIETLVDKQKTDDVSQVDRVTATKEQEAPTQPKLQNLVSAAVT